MNRYLPFLEQLPKAWLTDTGKVFRDFYVAEANTYTGTPKPLYLKPTPSKELILELADLWSPNDKLAQEKTLTFASKLFGTKFNG